MAKTNLGPVALKPKGEYSNAAAYTRLDVVTYRGGSYVALQNLTGVAPAENATNANWQCIAQKGGKGDIGQTGNTGSVGPSGADGFSPEAKVDETNTGATISIKDKSGTTTATVRHGVNGEAATVQVGTVTTGAAGSQAEVTNVGTSKDAVLDITIPKGDKGADGTMTFEDLTDEQRESLKGDTPFIGENGNWWIGATDTGVKAGVSLDTTLSIAGQAADAKAVGNELEKKINTQQEISNAGKVLGIGDDGNVLPVEQTAGVLSDVKISGDNYVITRGKIFSFRQVAIHSVGNNYEGVSNVLEYDSSTVKERLYNSASIRIAGRTLENQLTMENKSASHLAASTTTNLAPLIARFCTFSFCIKSITSNSIFTISDNAPDENTYGRYGFKIVFKNMSGETCNEFISGIVPNLIRATSNVNINCSYTLDMEKISDKIGAYESITSITPYIVLYMKMRSENSSGSTSLYNIKVEFASNPSDTLYSQKDIFDIGKSVGDLRSGVSLKNYSSDKVATYFDSSLENILPIAKITRCNSKIRRFDFEIVSNWFYCPLKVHVCTSNNLTVSAGYVAKEVFYDNDGGDFANMLTELSMLDEVTLHVGVINALNTNNAYVNFRINKGALSDYFSKHPETADCVESGTTEFMARVENVRSNEKGDTDILEQYTGNNINSAGGRSYQAIAAPNYHTIIKANFGYYTQNLIILPYAYCPGLVKKSGQIIQLYFTPSSCTEAIMALDEELDIFLSGSWNSDRSYPSSNSYIAKLIDTDGVTFLKYTDIIPGMTVLGVYGADGNIHILYKTLSAT